jgi:hypothetical protein
MGSMPDDFVRDSWWMKWQWISFPLLTIIASVSITEAEQAAH